MSCPFLLTQGYSKTPICGQSASGLNFSSTPAVDCSPPCTGHVNRTACISPAAVISMTPFHNLNLRSPGSKVKNFLAFSFWLSLKAAPPSKSPVPITAFLYHAQALENHLPEYPSSEQGPPQPIFLYCHKSSEPPLLRLNLACLLSKFHF